MMSPVCKAMADLLGNLHRDAQAVLDDLPAEALDWSPAAGINSVAVLLVHLAGAERYWIGDVAGAEPSGRVRAEEFESRDLSHDALRRRLDETLAHSLAVLERLEPVDLGAVRRMPGHDREHTVAWALGHALEHTAMHVGHLQLMRDWWRRSPTPTP